LDKSGAAFTVTGCACVAQSRCCYFFRASMVLNRRTIWVLMKRDSILAGVPLEKARPHALKHLCVTTPIRQQR
jgi:hypothetical protein